MLKVDGSSGRTRGRYLPVWLLVVFGSLAFGGTAESGTVTLAWSANPESNIGGYILHYGASPQAYSANVNVGNVTQYAFAEPVAGAVYFFALQAYNTSGQLSPLSNQISSTRLTFMNFDGDASSDIAVFRPSDGSWWVKQSGLPGYVVQTWGAAGDVPMGGDFDGDGKTDLGLFRPTAGYWYIRYSANGFSSTGQQGFRWGDNGDIPLLGDFDGDRRTDLTIYRPSTGYWYIWNSRGTSVYKFGSAGDQPVSADFDGDRKNDLVVYRPSTGQWFWALSSGGYSHLTWGGVKWGDPGDQPVSGDFDGDTRTDLAVYRSSNAYWYIRSSRTGSFSVYNWGAPGLDVPVVNDYDGDGRSDVAVFRPTTRAWYKLLSSTNFTNFSWDLWGALGDQPLLKR